MGCLTWRPVACPESVAENVPTMLPLALRVSRFPPVPLHNHEIVFGHGRIAVRSSAQRPLGLRGRSPPWLARGASACRASPPLRHRLCVRRSPAHPSAYAGAWSGSEYLPWPLRLASAASAQFRRPRKALAPWPVRRAAPALKAFLYGASLMLAPTREPSMSEAQIWRSFVSFVLFVANKALVGTHPRCVRRSDARCARPYPANSQLTHSSILQSSNPKRLPLEDLW